MDYSGFNEYLTDEARDDFFEEFPCDEPVTDEVQRKIAQDIAKVKDLSERCLQANQLVEFLVLYCGVPVRCIVQEVKSLYNPSFGRRLLRWQNAGRRDAQAGHPSRSQELAMVG